MPLKTWATDINPSACTVVGFWSGFVCFPVFVCSNINVYGRPHSPPDRFSQLWVWQIYLGRTRREKRERERERERDLEFRKIHETNSVQRIRSINLKTPVPRHKTRLKLTRGFILKVAKYSAVGPCMAHYVLQLNLPNKVNKITKELQKQMYVCVYS